MSDVPGLESDDDAGLAADYALGVLDGAARRAAERRMARDSLFAREVEAWEARLGPMALAVPEIRPSADIWSRIDADLSRMTRAAPQPASTGAAPSKREGRRVSAIWQYLGLAGMGLAAASGAALLLVVAGANGLLGPGPAVADRAMTATLASETGTPLFTVVLDAASGMATFVPVGAAPSDGVHVHELWLVPPGGAPRSLGVLQGAGPMRMPFGDAEMSQPDAALAISLEPAGGSPTGLPTGKVVASGPLRSI